MEFSVQATSRKMGAVRLTTEVCCGSFCCKLFIQNNRVSWHHDYDGYHAWSQADGVDSHKAALIEFNTYRALVKSTLRDATHDQLITRATKRNLESAWLKEAMIRLSNRGVEIPELEALV